MTKHFNEKNNVAYRLEQEALVCLKKIIRYESNENKRHLVNHHHHHHHHHHYHQLYFSVKTSSKLQVIH